MNNIKYHTSTIPPALAEKLKEKGMVIANVTDPMTGEKSCLYTYAHIFDWLMSEKDIDIEIRLMIRRSAKVRSVMKCVERLYGWKVSRNNNLTNVMDGELTWHEAANAAIEKALELI